MIAGPTGTGKSALSLDLAERLIGQGRAVEVINADSMQLYRGMDIGTAKLSIHDRARVPHHLFDVLDVKQTANVAAYQREARRTILDIQSRRAIPILVGGTGLYISAVIHGLEFPERDEAVRAHLEADLAENGAASLWRRLLQEDPAAAAAIDQGNGRKIVRALEVIAITGQPFSARLPKTPKFWQSTIQLFLDGDRVALRERLAGRSEQMWREGLLDEVRRLLPLGIEQGITARRAIGYAQALAVLHGYADEQQAISETTRMTNRYVRRQRSWFARYDELHRLDSADPALVDTAMAIVAEDAVRANAPS